VSDREIFKDVLCPTELARELNVSKRTLSRWARLRKGPARIKIGRKIYYRKATVENWLRRSEESFGALTGQI